MEGKNTNKSNIILIVLGCIIGAIILSFGVKTMIDYSSGNVYNEERPYGDCGTGCGNCVDNVCRSCASGYYAIAGSSSGYQCLSCPSGSYCTGGSSITGTCQAGSYSTGRASYCTPCSTGHYQPNSGQSSCTKCPAGTYQNKNGQSSCINVPAGYYQDEEGQSWYKPCTAGYYCEGERNARPDSACPAGHYCPEGSSSPKRCEGNTYSGQGASSCAPCDGTVNDSKTTCTLNCNSGEYSANGKCNTCEAGYYCPDGITRFKCDDGKTSSPGSVYDSNCMLIPATKVTISGSSLVTVGGTIKLSASITPLTALQNVLWSSGDPTVATVDSSGNVTAKKVGTTTITATAKSDINIKDTLEITVIEMAAILSCDNNSIYVGETTKCEFIIDGKVQNSGVTFSLNDSASAELTGTLGVIKGKSYGTVTITAMYNGLTASTTLLIKTTTQETPCSVGYFMSNTTCEKCRVGDYCEDGHSAKHCPDGTTSSQGAKSLSECYPENTGECSVRTSITSKHVSISTDSTTVNSYYEVTAIVNGDCDGNILKYSATNSKKIIPEMNVLTSSGTSTFKFKVYPQKACANSTATAALNNGNSSSVTLDKNQVFNDWIIENGCWSKSKVVGKPIGSFAADSAGLDEYYDKYVWDDDGNNGCYTIHAYRKGCGSSAEDESEDLPEKPSNGACYKDNNNNYTWANSAPAGYTLASNVSRDECEGNSSGTYACYKNDSNHYVWAVTAPSGYTIVDGANEDNCKKPPAPACYKNSQNDYQWTSTPASGYTKVPSINEEQYCDVNDNSACFSDSFGNYVWGDYNDNTSYTKITDIKSPEKCNRPAACYMNSNNEFVWGQYSNNSSYIIVDGIDNSEDCNNLVNVPPTAANVFNIIYISVAVMALFGGAVVYYVYRKKKLNLK